MRCESLLEADVNFTVVKEFVASVTEKAVGKEVLSSCRQGSRSSRLFMMSWWNSLAARLRELRLDGRQPVTIMLAGLQGSGKTTTAAKLARQLKEQGRKPLLVPADVYRPAAIEQLHVLGEQIDVPVYGSTTERIRLRSARLAVKEQTKSSMIR